MTSRSPKPKPNGDKAAGPTPAELLAKMPRRPMNAEQQAEALQKVQQQAAQRVKLGQQLFEAAEARLKRHQQVLEEIQGEQQKLREQVQQDVAKSLQSYDQWMGRIDESFTQEIRDLNMRIDMLESRFDDSRGDMEAMIDKAAALLNQTQDLMAEAFGDQAVDQVASEMQQSVPADPHIDIEAIEDMVLPPVVDEGAADGDRIDAPEIDGIDSSLPAAADGMDDVFGEVLRRLRSQMDEDGQAAA